MFSVTGVNILTFLKGISKLDQNRIALKIKYNRTYLNSSILRLFIAVIGYLLAGFILKSDTILLFFIFAMNIYCMAKSRNNSLLFIINFFLLFSNYSIYVYYFSACNTWGLDYGYYWFMQFPELLHKGVDIIYIFTMPLYVFFPNVKKNFSKENLLTSNKENNNNEMTYIFIIGIVLISSWSILTRIIKGYFPTSTIYEYMSILFILGYYHASNNKRLNRLITILLFINIIHILTSGDRMPAIQFMMIYYANFLYNRLKKRFLLLVLLVGIIALNAIGMWRGLTQFDMNIFIKSINYLFTRGITLDTAFAAEAAGLGMVKFAGDCSWNTRIYLFGIYIAYIFLGARPMGRNSNLSLLAEDAYPHFRGGGVLPNYGYFYLGILGVILLGILVVYYFHVIANINKESKGYYKCLSVQIFITTMSWYLYSPSPLIRGVLIMTILYYLSTKFVFNTDRRWNISKSKTIL